jgi:hypothetical protein
MNVVFNYKGLPITIQCKIDETMEEVSKKFKNKIDVNNASYLGYIYN